MVLSAAQRINETIDVPLLDAHGYVLSQDVLSTIDVPRLIIVRWMDMPYVPVMWSKRSL